MDFSNLLFGLLCAGIKGAARKASEENPDKNTFVGAVANAITRVENQAGVYRTDIDEQRERFSDMSDYELKCEIKRIKSDDSGSYARAIKAKAMTEEIERRRKERGG